MRLASDEAILAAVDAGVTVFDTARAYDGNEELLARALRGNERARIVTKGGMAPGWIPDGRAKTLRADCEASLAALDGLPIDLYLIHAPDPRTPWSTTVRALARLADEGLVRRVGVGNVNRRQLDEALELAPIAAVQVALSRVDERALRGGVVERCDEAGIALIAHSPLGGPKRAKRLDAEEALAWVLSLSPNIVAIPGATRAETVRSSVRAAATAPPAGKRSRRPRSDADVVLIMGIPGAGKSRLAEDYVARGYLRLNRDERGGSLRALADALREELAAGAQRVVLDNTYLTRASRSYVVESGARVRCIWVDTPLAQAQINIVLRGDESMRPTSQMRAVRELEPPADDEGFAGIERVELVREPSGSRPGVLVAAGAVHPGWQSPLPAAPHLVFDWRPDGSAADLAAEAAIVGGDVETAVCPHGGGPPTCWCRPPLPLLPLTFARAHDVDLTRSILVGTGPAHRNLAAALGAAYVSATTNATSST